MSITLIIILFFAFVFIFGFIKIQRNYKALIADNKFAIEYRAKFIAFANKYFSTYDRYSLHGEIDNEMYVWLTMNVNKIQSNLGHLGTMYYVGHFQRYQIPNYQIIINTLPKFRNGSIEDLDIHSTDDCLLRYIGSMEKVITKVQSKLINPIVWFKEGFQEIFSLPFYILNWFGIISDRSFHRITVNTIFGFFSGIGSLVAFFSGVVTIIQGKEQTLELIRKFWPTFLQ